MDYIQRYYNLLSLTPWNHWINRLNSDILTIITMGDIMSFFTHLLSSISIPIIITMMLLLIRKLNSKELQKNLTKEHIVIRLSKVYLWIGILDIAVFSTFCFIMFFFPNDTTTWWVWMIFILLGFCLVCSTLIFKIDI